MKKMLFFAAFAAAGVLFAGEPARDFQTGITRMEQRKYAAAVELFDGVAKNSTGELKEKALLYKALAMSRNRKMKIEEIQPAIDAIPNAKLKNYATMSMLANRGRHKEILAGFDNEKIEEWPEDYAYMGWKLRGEARLNRRMYDKAVADLLLAEKNAGSDKETLLLIDGSLFNAYCAKKDYENAIKVIERIKPFTSHKNSKVYLRPVLASVDAYIPLKKFAEAHKTLDILKNRESDQGIYGCLYHISRGRVYQAEGKNAEAKASFEKAMNCKNGGRSYLTVAKRYFESVK